MFVIQKEYSWPHSDSNLRQYQSRKTHLMTCYKPLSKTMCVYPFCVFAERAVYCWNEMSPPSTYALLPLSVSYSYLPRSILTVFDAIVLDVVFVLLNIVVVVILQPSGGPVGHGRISFWGTVPMYRGFFEVRILAKEGGNLDHVDVCLLPRFWYHFFWSHFLVTPDGCPCTFSPGRLFDWLATNKFSMERTSRQ